MFRMTGPRKLDADSTQDSAANQLESVPSISLLHATWFSSRNPLSHRDEWLSFSANPEAIEYIPAMDADDLDACNDTSALKRFVGPAQKSSGFSSAVKNWNGAAQLARGSLLFVISDDLFPPNNWDQQILEKLYGLRPEFDEFVLKVRDTPFHRDWRVSHPIVSKQYYHSFGLFCNDYSHLYVDRDFTLFAFWNSVIFDGRDIFFRHEHPSLNPEISPNVSQQRGNRAIEREHGRAVFKRRWRPTARITKIRFVTPSSEILRDAKWIEVQNSLRSRARLLFLSDLIFYFAERVARAGYWFLVGQVKSLIYEKTRSS